MITGYQCKQALPLVPALKELAMVPASQQRLPGLSRRVCAGGLVAGVLLLVWAAG